MRYIMAETHQFDLVAACTARDMGITIACLNNADYLSLAKPVAREIYYRQGHVTSDDVRKAMEERGYEPNSGAIFGALFRGKDWVCIGEGQSKIVSNHGRRIYKWVLREGAK